MSFLVHSARKSAPFTAFNVLTFPYTSSTIPFSWRAEQVSGAHTQRSLFFLLLIYILIKSKMTHQWSFSPPPGSSSLQYPWSLGLALQRAQQRTCMCSVIWALCVLLPLKWSNSQSFFVDAYLNINSKYVLYTHYFSKVWDLYDFLCFWKKSVFFAHQGCITFIQKFSKTVILWTA